MQSVHSLILAAGKGSRMRSELPKPLVPLLDKPLLGYLLEALHANQLGGHWVVVGHQGEKVESYVGSQARCVWQHERLGTAHAVESALSDLPDKCEHLLVFVGDSPLVRPQTIQQLVDRHLQSASDCTFLTATFDQHFPYARVLTRPDGRLEKVVEERDATEEEKKVREYLTSHFIFRTAALRELIPQIQAHPRTGERYLTDMIALLMAADRPVNYEKISDYRELVGLNTPEDLAWARDLLQNEAAWA